MFSKRFYGSAPRNAERQANHWEAANTNFKVIGLTKLRIKAESTALEAVALSTWSSGLYLSPR